MGQVTRLGVMHCAIWVGSRRPGLLGAGNPDPHLRWYRDTRRSQGSRQHLRGGNNKQKIQEVRVGGHQSREPIRFSSTWTRHESDQNNVFLSRACAHVAKQAEPVGKWAKVATGGQPALETAWPLITQHLAWSLMLLHSVMQQVLFLHQYFREGTFSTSFLLRTD